MKARPVNLQREPYDVYIGRGSRWGNPYRIGQDGSREEVIQKYKAHLTTQRAFGKITNRDLLWLRGKRLGCYCKPKACHGDIIANVVNELTGADLI